MGVVKSTFKYYSNGVIWEQTNTYVDNPEKSTLIIYFMNGAVYKQTEYMNGLPHGTESEYFKDGRIVKENIWENGVLVHTEDFSLV